MAVEKKTSQSSETVVSEQFILPPGQIYGLDQSRPQIPGRFPWSYRSEKQWNLFTSVSDVTRLFAFAANHDQADPESAYDWIISKDLILPFMMNWKGNIAEMTQIVNKQNDYGRGLRKIPAVEALYPQAENLFTANPSLYQYLMATRMAVRERNKLVRADERSEFNVDQRRKEILGENYSEDQKAQFQQLIEIFYSQALRYGQMRSRRSSTSGEEWESMAGLYLTQSVANFYWETMAINPRLTTDRFLRVLFNSIQDPASGVFDTRVLEVTTEAMRTYHNGNTTEAEALSKESDQEVEALVERFANSTQIKDFLLHRITHGSNYKALKDQFGITRDKASEIVAGFRQFLQTQSANGETPLSVPQTHKKPAENYFWNDLFQNMEKYQTLFDEKRPMLTPFRQQVLDFFFTLQTGDKQTTIDAVFEAMAKNGSKANRDSIRRAINGSINLINYRERTQVKHGHLTVGWSRHEQAKMFDQAAQDPAVWTDFSERDQYVLRRFFLEGRGREVTQKQIAEEVGINAATVSRIIERAIRRLHRSKGSIVENQHLAYKPRNHLPK